jgi:thioredoxin-dependent peroxiredoxin
VAAEILGISFDTPAENLAFAEEQAFPYRLLSDADHATGRAYGAEREPDERGYGFAKRLTFLIDPEGVIRKVYEVSDFSGHSAEVLKDIRELAGT